VRPQPGRQATVDEGTIVQGCELNPDTMDITESNKSQSFLPVIITKAH